MWEQLWALATKVEELVYRVAALERRVAALEQALEKKIGA